MKKINCIWEHNGEDSLIYAENFIGAFSRGQNKQIALSKIAQEVKNYAKWLNLDFDGDFTTKIVQECVSNCDVCDADSVVIFDSEKQPLAMDQYQRLKQIALKSAQDFLTLYEAIPDKNTTMSSSRKTFYGTKPVTANQIYQHTKNVNAYYFCEIGVQADNNGSIVDCRKRAFELLEAIPNFLFKQPVVGSYDETWSLAKVLRRFIWHDRIHAKALYKTAVRCFGDTQIPNPFCFELQ